MEAEQQAKRDAVRLEQERKKEEEREKKRNARAEKMGDFIDDDDIFRRRQRELDEKKRRREQRKKDDIWKRREEHKRGMKERDKEKLMAKMREDARKVAMLLSKGSQGHFLFILFFIQCVGFQSFGLPHHVGIEVATYL